MNELPITPSSVVASAVSDRWRWKLTPAIGEPRVVDSDGFMLYPGETATAQLSTVDVRAVMDGQRVSVRQWMIEPAPGLSNCWKRFRYRWFGWVPMHPGRMDPVTFVAGVILGLAFGYFTR